MAIGLSRAGFSHAALVESDPAAFATLVANAELFGGADDFVFDEVQNVDYRQYKNVDLLAAGAPCQPWSQAGKRLQDRDHRNLFPEVLRAQSELLPRAVLIENVRGLAAARSGLFVERLSLALEHPQSAVAVGPAIWRAVPEDLRRELDAAPTNNVRYRVRWATLQAADYGIPQMRSRLFLVALRNDVVGDWIPPVPTHRRKGVAGLKNQARVATNGHPLLPGWRTVQEAIGDLPSPTRSDVVRPSWHFHQPGARSYNGHTGSRPDRPAKTLKAGVHGVAGGENTLRLRNGRVRYFTIREAARLQTFPDAHEFAGSWCDAVRQVGNAVPVVLAEAVGRSIMSVLTESSV